MTKLSTCPNCGAELTEGLFKKGNALLSKHQIRLINEYSEQQAEVYCTSCGADKNSHYVDVITRELEELPKDIKRLITSIPVITAQSPHNWEYEVLNIVTGQSTIGTGFITEFSSGISDILGVQSAMHNIKLKEGEDVCLLQLRGQTLNMGGNAVIATNLAYAEMGFHKGMVMVCMSGTAVRITNPAAALGEDRVEQYKQLIAKQERYLHLRDFVIQVE